MSNHVYRFLNKEKEVIYVGKTKNKIMARLRNHFNGGHLNKQKLLEVEYIDYTTFKSKLEMDVAEIYLINLWEPKLNTTSKHGEHVNFHPFDIESLEFTEIINPVLDSIKGCERIEEEEMQAAYLGDIFEENELLKYLLNEYENGNVFDYRQFVSEYEYAESVKRFGVFIKPDDLDGNYFDFVKELLIKHSKGETSKTHCIKGKEL